MGIRLFLCSCILAGLVAAAPYLLGGILDGAFVFDDHHAITSNLDITTDTPLPTVLGNDFWGRPLARLRSHKSYRPLSVLSFRLDRLIAGGMDPRVFHRTNVLLHSGVSSLVVVVARTAVFRGADGLPYSLFAGLLFALHPVHVEAVAGVVGRAEILCCLFYLIAVIAHHMARGAPVTDCDDDGTRRKRRRRGGKSRKSGFASLPWFVISMVSAFCAVLSKEQGITAFALLLVIDTADGLLPAGTLSARLSERPLRRRLLSVVLVAACVVVWRLAIQGGVPVFVDNRNPSAGAGVGFLSRTLTLWHYASRHAWLLVWPRVLCCDWSGGSIPLVKSLFDARNAGSLALLAAASALAGPCLPWGRLSLWRRGGAALRPLAVSVALLVLPFVLSSNLFFFVGFAVAERVLYTPSLGFCLLVSIAARRCCLALSGNGKSPPRRRSALLLLQAVAGAVLAAAFSRTLTRTGDWLTQEQLFRSGVQVAPNNALLQANLANQLAADGRFDESEEQFRRALEVDRERSATHYLLANMQHVRGHLDDAERAYEATIAADRRSARGRFRLTENSEKAMAHLGNIMFGRGEFAAAEARYREALKSNAAFAMAHNGLAKCFDRRGETDAALSAARRALETARTPGDRGTAMMLLEQLEGARRP